MTFFFSIFPVQRFDIDLMLWEPHYNYDYCSLKQGMEIYIYFIVLTVFIGKDADHMDMGDLEYRHGSQNINVETNVHWPLRAAVPHSNIK